VQFFISTDNTHIGYWSELLCQIIVRSLRSGIGGEPPAVEVVALSRGKASAVKNSRA
jgi:hypothetical protein